MPILKITFKLIICMVNIHDVNYRKKQRAMNLRSIDLNLLTVFEAVYEDRNFTRAAERLGVTQPALSNAIKRLRDQIGDPLFVRAAGGVAPTPKADMIAVHVASALESVRVILNDDGPFDPMQTTRSFKICIGDFGESIVLPEVYNKAKVASSKVELDTLSGLGRERINDLRTGIIDLAWDFMPLEDPNLKSELVVDDHAVCIMRADHPFANEELTLEKYMSARHVMLHQSPRYVQPTEQILRRQGHTRDAALVVEHVMSVILVVSQTHLLASTARSAAQAYAKGLGLVIKPLPIEPPPVKVYQTWHNRMDADPAHIWLRTQFAEAAVRLLAPDDQRTPPHTPTLKTL